MVQARRLSRHTTPAFFSRLETIWYSTLTLHDARLAADETIQKFADIHQCGIILRQPLVHAFQTHNLESSVLSGSPQAPFCLTCPTSCSLDLKLAGIANMILEAESSLYYAMMSAQELRYIGKDHDINIGLESACQVQHK